jgi:hypothetical protein
VSPDALGAVTGHQADDQRTRNRHKDHKRTQVMTGGGYKSAAPPQVKEEIGEKTGQPQQGQCDKGAENADSDRNQRERDDLPRGGKITELAR